MINEKQDSPNFDGLVQPGRDAQKSAKADEGLADLGGTLVAHAQLSTHGDETADLSDLSGERGGPVLPTSRP